MAFFLISITVLGLLDQPQIFRQLYLIELLGLLTGLGVVAGNIPKAFNRVWHAGILHKLKSCGISGQILGHISSFLSNRRVIVYGKS